MNRRRLLFCVAAAASVALVARAATVSIDPIRVHLSATNRSQSLTLTNSGQESLRFQISAFTWQQNVAGEMELTPTEELVFFPAFLELGPSESRRVRVASTAPAGAKEKSFRLFLDELPPLQKGQPGSVRVLTRLGVPVFVQPAAPTARPSLDVRIEGSRVLVVLENRGNSYFLAQSVHVVGRSATGSTVVQQDLPGWYVLAGGRRVYDLGLTKEVFCRLVDVNIKAKTDHGVAQVAKKLPSVDCASD